MLPVWISARRSTVVCDRGRRTTELYPTEADRAQVAGVGEHRRAAARSTARPFDLTTVGGLTAWRIAGLASVLVGLMSLLLVVRHTRAEEEAGRAELLGAAVVGRHAPLDRRRCSSRWSRTSSLALLSAVGLIAVGLPAAGSFAFGLAIGPAGLVFAAVALVAAQLTAERPGRDRHRRRACSALAYLLRAVGDSGAVRG